ncbi:hypothetical protein [Corynebacterium variabile]|uniref:hypothetical protein n=1 Tax=Corynebacterium variabile TaxID=1727 RepID=UPI003A93D96B
MARTVQPGSVTGKNTGRATGKNTGSTTGSATTRRRTGFPRPADSVRVVLYRLGALFLGIVWPLWILQLALTRTGPGGAFAHWYTTATLLLFLSAEVLLLVAWASGGLRVLTVALRYCGLTLVIALLLLFTDPFTGSVNGVACLWFSGMTGVPVVAVALTVPRPVATAFFLPTVGVAAAVDSIYGDDRSVLYLVGVIGFALIYSYYFVAVASTMIRLVSVVDSTAASARQERDRAASLRRHRVEEDAATARLRDSVLDGLDEIAHGRTSQVNVTGVTATTEREDTPEAPEDPPIEEVTGFDRVFSWPYLLFCGLVLACRMTSTVSVSVASVVTCGVLIGALSLLGTRGWGIIPRGRSLVVAAALSVAGVIGLWQGPVAGDGSVGHWEIGAISLVAALLATRGRAVAAVGGVAVAVALTAAVGLSGLSPAHGSVHTGLALGSIVVLAAVLLRRAVDHFVRQIPGAQREYRSARAEADAVAVTVDAERARRHALLDSVAPVIEAAARVTAVSPALARRAELMRLQIMDEASAPRLAVPALQEAVRDARGRGVTVRFVDDGAGGTGEDAALTEAQTVDLLARYLPLIDNADRGTVTVRCPV